MKFRIALLPALFFIAPALAFANAEAAPGVPSGTFVQAFLGLALIVVLLGGLAWFAKKLTGGQSFGQRGLRVIGGVALGPRERLVLVEVGDQWLVVGIVPGQIRTLHTLPKGSLADPEGADPAQSFPHWLRQMIEKRGHAS